MNFETTKNLNDRLLGLPLALGGICVADLGIYFIQEGHDIGSDIVATPSVAIGFYMAARGTMKFMESLGMMGTEQRSSDDQPD